MASNSNKTEDDNDEFYDACTLPTTMDLDTALEQAKLAINLFFNNRFEEARNLMKPWADSSMYHSVGNCVFSFLEAMLTFEQQHIVKASESLKLCLIVCNKYRRKTTITESIGKTFKKTNYQNFTDIEAHAELCSAEALLLKAMLTFIEDETLSSLIKGGIKTKTCFNSYKECYNILIQRNWSSETSKIHFESGVRMGIGTFNLMISLLPGRVIKLLEFIGFSGNKTSGLNDLILGSEMKGIRQVLCIMTLLGYNLIVCYVLSHQEGDLKLCETILTKQLEIYPNGVWFLFFKGRLEFMNGNLDKSIFWYNKSLKSQNLWLQFHHLCYWELLWVNCIKLEWRQAILYSTYLIENSKWSQTIYTYQKSILLMMIEPNELKIDELKLIENLMRELPDYKQKIAGKSLPMEKFAIKKSERYFQQNKKLILPAIELMYVWNLFKILGKSYQLADGILKIIEKTEKLLKNEKTSDNLALILLLKGACLRQMNSPLQALNCLEEILKIKNDIKFDFYIVPYAIVEIALIYIEQKKYTNAINALEDAKKNYTGYCLESRLHFRIHSALTDLKETND